MPARIRLLQGIAAGLLTAVGACAGVVTSAGAVAPETVTASCDGPRDASASAPGTYRFAQTFAPRANGELTSAQVDVTKAPGTSGNWVIQVVVNLPTPISTPTHETRATTTIPDSTVPVGESTITGRFADPATIFTGGAPEREYQLVVTRPGATGFAVGYREGNDCAGQLFRSESQTGPLNAFGGATNDLVFEARVSDVTAPETRFTREPKRRTAKHRARFTLRADEDVERFECVLDGDPRECDSHTKLRVGAGRHKFKARAVDLAGNVDPSPAKRKWKVLR